MNTHGLSLKASPFARGLAVVRFRAALDVAAQRRARACLAEAGALDAGELGDDALEAWSCYVAGAFTPPDGDEGIQRIHAALGVLASDLGATAAFFVQVGTVVDAVAASAAEEAALEEVDAEDDDAPAKSFWKAGPPPRVDAPTFPLERYPAILEDYDWQDFGIALKLGGPALEGEETLLRAVHAFWLAPYVDDALPAEDDGPSHPFRHADMTMDARHRAALFWVDRFAPPALDDEIIHHLLWVVSKLHEIVPVIHARFDHATMEMKYGALTGNTGPFLVLAGNPLLARFEKEGEAAALAWAESQSTFSRLELSAMFVEVGREHAPDEAGPAAIALRLFERALALDPTNDEAAASLLTVLVAQDRLEDAVVRATKWGDVGRKLHVVGLVVEDAPAELSRLAALTTRDVLEHARGEWIGDLVGATAAHAPELLDDLLAALPSKADLVAYVFNAFARASDPGLQLKVLLRAVAMPTPAPDAGPHRTAYLSALNNACVVAHAMKDYALAVELAEKAKPYADENPPIHHAAACAYAAVGEHVKAFLHVKQAVLAEYEHLDKLEVDTDLGPIPEWPEHRALFAEWRARAAKSEPVVVATDETFDDDVLRHETPVLVDFTASWCGPCQRLAPIVERMAVTSYGRYRVVKVDVDESEATAARFAVKSMPTLIVFVAGQERARHVGLTDKPALERLVRDATAT